MESEQGLGGLAQVSMLCRSADQAEAWYRDVLGLPHLFSFGPLVFFDCRGTRLFIRAVPDAEWRASSTLYFSVADIAAAHATLVDRGVRFSEAPQVMHRHADGIVEWMAFFADPDGNVLALMSKTGAA